MEKSEQNSEESIGEILKLRKEKSDELNKLLAEKNKTINKELFKKYFRSQSLSAIQKELYKTKGRHSNKIIVNIIENGLEKLKDDINNTMRKDKIEI